MLAQISLAMGGMDYPRGAKIQKRSFLAHHNSCTVTTHNAAHAAAAQAVDQVPDGLHAEQQAHGPLCEPHQHVLNESSWLGRAGRQSSDSESVGICVYAHE